jgi:adenylate cyclase
MKRWLDVLIPGALLLIAAWVSMQDVPNIDQLRNLVFDSYQRQRPREYRADLPVRIVDIDEESLKRLGQWPWPRDLVARLVDRLGELGATTVALDIIFARPDRFSPANLARQAGSPGTGGAAHEAGAAPDSDALLARRPGAYAQRHRLRALRRGRSSAPELEASLRRRATILLSVQHFPARSPRCR